MGITMLAVHLRIGIPPPNSTQIAEVARSAQSSGLFGAFQATTALLLLAAASFVTAGRSRPSQGSFEARAGRSSGRNPAGNTGQH